MGTPSGVKPVYHCIYSEAGTHPTCVVAGRNRHRAWLYVHAPTPLVLRLHPPVVRFLLDAISELSELSGSRVVGLGVVHRLLPRDTHLSHPECLVNGRGRNVRLTVFGASPSSITLVPPVVRFLEAALAGLPATAVAPAVDEQFDLAELSGTDVGR